MAVSFVDSFASGAESCVLVGVISSKTSEKKAKEYMQELDFLAHTAGLTVRKHFLQRLPQPDTRTFIGTGKLQEILQYHEENPFDCLIFDDELSPSQARNIEKVLKLKVIDRPGLILDIFAQRAHTAYAKTQVELAQYEYVLPRLTGLWTHLERQRGGIGMRGPGETQIETDRRIVRNKISFLKEKLKEIDQQMVTQRRNRGAMVKLALVGYTNVGKSTLMNVLSKAEVFAENKLFATLDTTVRKIVWHQIPFLLSDTVGFIRKLPHQLIESFKSTLDEVRMADLLLHVIDVSHEEFENQFEVVEKTIEEIGASSIPQVWVFNKIDQYPQEVLSEFDILPNQKNQYRSLDHLIEIWKVKALEKNAIPIFISATEKQNLEELKEILLRKIRSLYQEHFPHYPLPDENLWKEESQEQDKENES